MPAPKTAFISKPPLTTPHIIDRTDSEAFQEEIRQCIADRAYQLYEESGRQSGNDEGNWRQAEAKVLQRDIEVRESGTWLTLNAVLSDFAAEDVQIYVEPVRVIVKAEKQPLTSDIRQYQDLSPKRNKRFWAADLPVEVEPSTTTASLKNSKLSLVIKKRKESQTSAPASDRAS